MVVFKVYIAGWMVSISIDNLYALSEFFQVPIDEIVRGNKECIVPEINVKPMDCQTERLFVYYDKLNENQAA